MERQFETFAENALTRARLQRSKIKRCFCRKDLKDERERERDAGQMQKHQEIRGKARTGFALFQLYVLATYYPRTQAQMFKGKEL